MDKKVLMNEILTLLDKVNSQAQILMHLPNMARIDVDLLLAEIRQVYDKTLDLQLKIEISRQEPKTELKTESKPIITTSPIAESNNQIFVNPEPKPKEPTLFPVPETPKPIPPSEYKYSQYQQIPAPLPTSPAPIQVAPLNTTSATLPKSLQQAYEEKNADHSLASRLQYNPINDLRSAIGINDKFLLMSQLFKGSLEHYNAAIERLNNFYDYEDADIFLGSLKILHDWADGLPAIDKLQYFLKRRYQKE